MPSRQWTATWAVVCLFLAMAAGAQPNVDAPPLPVAAQPSAAAIGDVIQLTIDLPSAGDAESLSVSVPKEQRGLLVAGEPRMTDEGWAIPVRVLAPGDLELGPLTVRARLAGEQVREFTTEPFNVSISDPAAAPAESRDYTEPLSIPFDWTLRNLVLGAAGMLALVVIVLLVRWLLSRRSGEAVELIPPPLPPLEEASQALGRLATMDVFQTRGTKAHYSELSHLLRRYLERQFRFPALEMSEAELFEHVRRDTAGRVDLATLESSLQRASMAKFARWEAGEAQARDDLAAARGFLGREADRLRLEEAAARSREHGSRAA